MVGEGVVPGRGVWYCQGPTDGIQGSDPWSRAQIHGSRLRSMVQGSDPWFNGHRFNGSTVIGSTVIGSTVQRFNGYTVVYSGYTVVYSGYTVVYSGQIRLF